jgi:hypothetical protein
MTKTFSKRFNAQRAARAALKNPKAVEGKDFITAKNRFGQWDFVTMKAVKELAARNKADEAAADRRRHAEVAADEARLHRALAADKAAAKPKTIGKRAQIEADAAAGKLPTPPDFSAETHARFRKRLSEIEAFVKAGDIKALKADTTEPKSSSRVALCRYRDLAIIALEAQRAGKAAA